jgi:hypothetical protein
MPKHKHESHGETLLTTETLILPPNHHLPEGNIKYQHDSSTSMQTIVYLHLSLSSAYLSKPKELNTFKSLSVI